MRFFKNTLIAIFLVTAFSCTSDNSSDALKSQNGITKKQIISDNSSNHKSEAKGGYGQGGLTTESDMVYADGNGCYIVNVRVYWTNPKNGQKLLVANEDVKVGNCSSNKPNGVEGVCPSGFLKNGDFVYGGNKSDPNYCLLNLLETNEDVYQQYLDSIDELIPNLER